MNGPSEAALERLLPKVEQLLADSDRRCENGGRRVDKAKVGGYMTRRLVHALHNDGKYPAAELVWAPGCAADDCVDCGRFVVKANGTPPQPSQEPVPPPPPVPAAVPAAPSVGVVVERVERGARSEASGAAGSRAFQPQRSTLSPWARAAVRLAGVLVAVVVCFLVVTVAVQGVLAVVEKLPEVSDVVKVQVPSNEPANGE